MIKVCPTALPVDILFMSNNIPKLGLALSGAAARSAFYVGFLEYLQEKEVPVAIIGAQSGAAIVATCYACGTIQRLKKDLLTNNASGFRKLLLVRSRGRTGGLYSLDSVEEYGRNNWSLGKSFNEVQTRLCFTATNLTTGELVTLATGDLAKSVRITCSVPGLFEPVRWGNHQLVDGGLLSFIPGQLVRDAGADVVIGVSVRATKHIFLPHQIKFKGWYNNVREHVRSSALVKALQWSRRVMSNGELEEYGVGAALFDELPVPQSMFGVISRSLDLAVEASKQTAHADSNFGCDLVIREGVGNFGDSVNMTKMERLYREGWESAEQNLPKILELLHSK